MIEVTGNLWTFPADVRVITTNGTVKRNGECVMGRGCAAEAKQRWPDVPTWLGDHIKLRGNECHVVCDANHDQWNEPFSLVAFPVKHHWMQKADMQLIEQSARLLVNITDAMAYNVVVMPRPGCGNGHLRWTDVRPVLVPILDGRFHVITF